MASSLMTYSTPALASSLVLLVLPLRTAFATPITSAAAAVRALPQPGPRQKPYPSRHWDRITPLEEIQHSLDVLEQYDGDNSFSTVQLRQQYLDNINQALERARVTQSEGQLAERLSPGETHLLVDKYAALLPEVLRSSEVNGETSAALQTATTAVEGVRFALQQHHAAQDIADQTDAAAQALVDVDTANAKAAKALPEGLAMPYGKLVEGQREGLRKMLADEIDTTLRNYPRDPPPPRSELLDTPPRLLEGSGRLKDSLRTPPPQAEGFGTPPGLLRALSLQRIRPLVEVADKWGLDVHSEGLGPRLAWMKLADHAVAVHRGFMEGPARDLLQRVDDAADPATVAAEEPYGGKAAFVSSIRRDMVKAQRDYAAETAVGVMPDEFLIRYPTYLLHFLNARLDRVDDEHVAE